MSSLSRHVGYPGRMTDSRTTNESRI